MTISENAFETLASETLDELVERIEGALGEFLDIDLQGGVLTIELDTGGQYVINKHAPNRQLWMSSPVSGATHYDFDEMRKAWIAGRDGGEFKSRLQGELSDATGTELVLG